MGNADRDSRRRVKERRAARFPWPGCQTTPWQSPSPTPRVSDTSNWWHRSRSRSVVTNTAFNVSLVNPISFLELTVAVKKPQFKLRITAACVGFFQCYPETCTLGAWHTLPVQKALQGSGSEMNQVVGRNGSEHFLTGIEQRE